jgi:hypothetical protein
LDEHDGPVGQEGLVPLNVYRQEQPIAAGRHSDLIPSLSINNNEGNACRRRLVSEQTVGRQPGCGKVSANPVAERIAPELCEKPDISSRQKRCDGLIRAFPTVREKQCAAENRLSLSRQCGDSHGHIKVGAADDDNLSAQVSGRHIRSRKRAMNRPASTSIQT